MRYTSIQRLVKHSLKSPQNTSLHSAKPQSLKPPLTAVYLNPNEGFFIVFWLDYSVQEFSSKMTGEVFKGKVKSNKVWVYLK